MQRVVIDQWVYDIETTHRTGCNSNSPSGVHNNEALHSDSSIINEIHYKVYRHILFPPIATDQFTPGCPQYIPVLHDFIRQ
ncbi:uncharacterized protein DI49_0154 [Saccharomyces eubayanus]|uniref:uncharacterized protein n=1 Tax=Saccharomyces eubayanus TaxID=1080349 RepID=UPI0006C4F9A2|nr:hypothetical protein DI49_0154 [Saccharomyces eubayanus]KOH00819.1 hypothetical protein DI49_0154 [Saccharomyces eubayanus]